MSATHPALRPETLLEHAEWVRALARTLVYDPDRVDDVVQETWVAALKAPPASTDRLRGWLATVVRNVARQTGRAEGRRRRREQATPPADPALSTGAVFARASLHRELVEHVFALDEAHRDVVLLRYFEGLTPQQIARKRGTPVATVKTRLQRALARLRTRLDNEHGDRGSWCAALAPLLAKGGGVVGSGKVVAVAAACALLVGAWFVAPHVERSTRGSDGRALLALPLETEAEDRFAAGSAESSPATATSTAVEPATRESADRTASAPPEGAATFQFAGRVVDEHGRGVSGVTVHAVDEDALRWSDAEETELVGRSFWLPLSKERRDALRAAPAELDRFVEREFTDPIAARALILGEAPSVASTRTDADGRYSLGARTEGSEARVVDPRWCHLGTANRPDATKETLLIVVPAVRVAGRVVDRDGRAVGGAEVSLRCVASDLPHLDPGLEWQLRRERSWKTASDADGRFVFAQVAGSKAAQVGVGLLQHGGPNTYGGLGIPLPETGREELTLLIDVPTRVLELEEPPRVTITGSVRQPDGSPARGAHVSLRDEATRADERGRYELSVDPDEDGWPTLWAVLPGIGYAELPDFLAGRRPFGAGPLRADLTLAQPFRVIRGRVVDEGGHGQAGVEVELLDGVRRGPRSGTIESLHGSRMFQAVVTDAAGAFVHDGLLDRAYRLSVSVEDITVRTAPLQAGTSDVLLRVPERGIVPVVSGVVVGRDGAPLVGVTIGIGGVRVESDEHGRWSLAEVSRRRDLLVRGSGLEQGRWPPDEWVDGDDLRLVLHRPCRFVVVPTDDAADAFALLDERERPMKLRSLGRSSIQTRVARDADGFPVCDATDAAAWIVLYRGEDELRRTRVALDPTVTMRIAP